MASLNIEPVGEFGSLAWCEACAEAGARLLRDAQLPAGLEWGFSEIYTLPPARLLAPDRTASAYHIMVKEGSVSGGDGAPAECRALPGFHVELPWAAICNQSRTLYGRAGQRQRAEDEAVMYREIEEHVGRANPLGLKPRAPAVWPPEVAAALGAGAEEGGGLHNIAASLQKPSPEFAELPVTELGVPAFSRMTAEQKRRFLALLGVAARSTSALAVRGGRELRRSNARRRR